MAIKDFCVELYAIFAGADGAQPESATRRSKHAFQSASRASLSVATIVAGFRSALVTESAGDITHAISHT